MRHRNTVKTLDRKSAARKMLMRNLVTSFVLYEKIETTEAKAKAVKPIVEKFITKSKKDDLATRRQLLSFFTDKNAVNKMLEVVGPKYKDRAGGYTRIIRLAPRQGDGAQMVKLELI